MIEGSLVTVLEAFDFLLGAMPTLGPGKPLAGYDMLGNHARALDLALQLRQEADRLIQEAGRPGPARQAVEGAYRNQLLQNQLLQSIRRGGRF